MKLQGFFLMCPEATAWAAIKKLRAAGQLGKHFIPFPHAPHNAELRRSKSPFRKETYVAQEKSYP